jgi:hypothetical protein
LGLAGVVDSLEGYDKSIRIQYVDKNVTNLLFGLCTVLSRFCSLCSGLFGSSLFCRRSLTVKHQGQAFVMENL